MRLDRIRDVLLRRPAPPEDERERKARDIEALGVEFKLTDNRVKRLLASWRRRSDG